MGRLEEEADVTTPLKPVPLLFLFRILQLPLATLLLRRDDIYHRRVGIMSSHQKTPTKTREEKKEMAVLIALRVSLLSCCRVRLHRGVFHGWLVHRWWRGEFFFSPKRRSKKKKGKKRNLLLSRHSQSAVSFESFVFDYKKIRSSPFSCFRILVKISQWVLTYYTTSTYAHQRVLKCLRVFWGHAKKTKYVIRRRSDD